MKIKGDVLKFPQVQILRQKIVKAKFVILKTISYFFYLSYTVQDK